MGKQGYIELESRGVDMGIARFAVTRIGFWVMPQLNRHNATIGAEVVPEDMVLEIPVEGNNVGPEELGDVVRTTFKTLLPAVRVFVDRAAENFGDVGRPKVKPEEVW